MELESGVSLPRGTVHIYRTKFLTELVCYDQITLNNYGETAIDVDVSFDFDADFADIFEVRGEKRKRRGEKLPEEMGRSSVTLAYEGLDDIRRTTRMECSAAFLRTAQRVESRFRFILRLMARRASRSMSCANAAVNGPAHVSSYGEALQGMNHSAAPARWQKWTFIPPMSSSTAGYVGLAPIWP